MLYGDEDTSTTDTTNNNNAYNNANNNNVNNMNDKCNGKSMIAIRIIIRLYLAGN